MICMKGLNVIEKIGVLTYNIKHRKTYDTLCLLKARGYHSVDVYAQPLQYKKSFHPWISHRPGIAMDIPDTAVLCKHFGYFYKEVNLDELSAPKKQILLVCGAGIIPEEFVKEHIIVNSHPGYIPFARGLDSMKWSIWENNPLGVTTHIIGEHIDGGEIIERRLLEVLNSDTFFEAAMRVYETEISMLVNSLNKLHEDHIFINPEGYEIHKRMPHEIEKRLLEKFEIYKINYHEIMRNSVDSDVVGGI